MSLRVAAAAVATVFVPAAGDLLVTLEPGTAPTPGDPSGPVMFRAVRLPAASSGAS